MDWWNTINGPGTMVLAGLWVLWAVFLFGGFAFGKPHEGGTRRMPRWTRMASSAMLVLAGLTWAWLARSSPAANGALLLAIGMAFGFLGDLTLAHLVPMREPVLGGMAAFGLGHVAYIVGMALWADTIAPTTTQWALAFGGWLVAAAIGWYLIVWRPSQRETLHRIALPYALLLAATAAMGTVLTLADGSLWPLALGGALFLLSDLVLATQLFNGARWPLISDVVWLTYGPGQMLIVFGVGAALGLM